MKKGDKRVSLERAAIVESAIDLFESIPLAKNDRRVMERVTTKMLPTLVNSHADQRPAWRKKKTVDDILRLLGMIRVPRGYAVAFGLTTLKLSETWGRLSC